MFDIDIEEVKFDYQIEDKPAEVVSHDEAAAECDDTIYFKGTRGDLQDYLQLVYPELYKKVCIYTVNGKTRDWFGALSSDFLFSALKNNGFLWENEKIRITLKDKKKDKAAAQQPQPRERYEVDWNLLDNLPERDVF